MDQQVIQPLSPLFEEGLERLGQNGDTARKTVGQTIPEGQRDITLTSLAGYMRARGLAESEIGAALHAVNHNRCNPPLEDDQVDKIARSIGGYPTDGRITDVAEGREIAERLLANRAAGFRLRSDVEIENMPKPPFIFGDKITQGGLSVLAGPPGSGKTFFALAALCSVASGIPLGQEHVHRTGSGIYVAAEGSSGIGARLRSWKDWHHVDRSLGMHFVTEPVALLNALETDEFLRVIATLSEPPLLVVIDTLARCMIGGDENSTQDMSNFIAGADRIRRETGAHVMLLHHLNAVGERERGNSALRGACDTMIFIKAEASGMTLTCEKQKDATPFPPLYLELVQCGDSCAITAMNRLQQEDAGLTAKQLVLLQLLQSHFLDNGATASEWLRACENMSDRTFFNCRTALVRRGYVNAPIQQRGGRYTLTDLGQAAVTANCNLTAISLQLQRP